MSRRLYQVIVAMTAVILAVFLGMLFLRSSKPAEAEVDETVQEVLASEEGKPVSDAAAVLSEAEQKRRQDASLTESGEAEQPGTDEAVENTENTASESGITLLFGDSRTSGFSAYGYWPDSQVIWMYEPVIQHEEEIEHAAGMFPEKIIFLNGLDDIMCYGAEDAFTYYSEYILRFSEAAPETEIYVHAVMPVSTKAFLRYPELKGIQNFNWNLQKFCQKQGFTYLNCMEGFSAGNDIGKDGIHFTAAWTKKWLDNMRAEAGF